MPANDFPKPLSGEYSGKPLLIQSHQGHTYALNNVFCSQCHNCNGLHLWLGSKMIYPTSSAAPLANEDTPPEILPDYNEARDILQRSPRGAAALLRLAIQKLCKELGESGKNINADIASLVKKGLDPKIQKALDVLRVVGNEAVHPGTIDLRDDVDTADSLFHFFNLIVEKMISEPKHIDDVYAKLPVDKLKAIDDRDK
ncbi:DUF4145 domain-containing protein [Rhizobium sp. P44RR-XXIV]|uniref:DUF4145 domain-containing protein n=1 Tax=Rhizobium sp. P44RR-XXIV TaxID=1921145 RepID=UPI00197D8C09|nr:DUF4145 domain-containing protein [Rhizobium sp. P44RR-XXIV]